MRSSVGSTGSSFNSTDSSTVSSAIIEESFYNMRESGVFGKVDSVLFNGNPARFVPWRAHVTALAKRKTCLSHNYRWSNPLPRHRRTQLRIDGRLSEVGRNGTTPPQSCSIYPCFLWMEQQTQRFASLPSVRGRSLSLKMDETPTTRSSPSIRKDRRLERWTCMVTPTTWPSMEQSNIRTNLYWWWRRWRTT